ncbi:hypothetical protein [Streptomyces griseoluteus]|uniref:hypothetical protein n=1 Tax=Streptomyces griseoluteus TaxID=29306 RepID=UPI00382B885F
MNDPVIKNLRPHTWSSEESVAYEAAIEAINGVIGVCSGLLTDAENRGVGEEASAYRRLRATCRGVGVVMRIPHPSTAFELFHRLRREGDIEVPP